jgi:hypothetical protein
MRVAPGTKRVEFDPTKYITAHDLSEMLGMESKNVGPTLFRVAKTPRYYDGKKIFFLITDAIKGVEALHNDVRSRPRRRLMARKAYDRLAASRAVPAPKPKAGSAPITIAEAPTANPVQIEVSETTVLALVRAKVPFRVL